MSTTNRRTFGSPGELASADPSRELSKTRERVLQMMLRGEVTTQDVMDELDVSERTAQAYISDPRIFKASSLPARPQALAPGQ